jgi:hypothetical protein
MAFRSSTLQGFVSRAVVKSFVGQTAIISASLRPSPPVRDGAVQRPHNSGHRPVPAVGLDENVDRPLAPALADQVGGFAGLGADPDKGAQRLDVRPTRPAARNPVAPRRGPG